jgi:hypothetical protein
MIQIAVSVYRNLSVCRCRSYRPNVPRLFNFSEPLMTDNTMHSLQPVNKVRNKRVGESLDLLLRTIAPGGMMSAEIHQ